MVIENPAHDTSSQPQRGGMAGGHRGKARLFHAAPPLRARGGGEWFWGLRNYNHAAPTGARSFRPAGLLRSGTDQYLSNARGP